jgi:RNA polymerase sigma factor (sigma-70 family)
MDEIEIVQRARDGDRDALGELLEQLRTPLFRLATSMFWDREDAEDATQEALIVVMTNLATFRGEASLSTWAHRIAVRLYLRRRRSPTENAGLTFDTFGADLLDGLATSDSARPDAELLAEEVRIGCTLGVLQCLDRDDRVVFVLGDVFGMSGDQAAAILEISHDAYRKRLERVRARLRAFVTVNCGIVNPDAACRCARRVDRAIMTRRVDPGALRFADRGALHSAKDEIVALHETAALFRAAGLYTAPADLAQRVIAVLDTATTILGDDRPG